MGHVSDLFKTTREKFDLTQIQISEKLGLTGPQYVSNIERGVVSVSPKRFKEFARCLGIQPQAILYAHLKDYELKIRNIAKI